MNCAVPGTKPTFRTPVTTTLTDLDHRIEAAVNRSVDTLWGQRDRGLLDGPLSALTGAHHTLAQAECGVTFYRELLHRLASGEYPVDKALLDRVERTAGQLRDAVRQRDAARAGALTALERAEAAVRTTSPVSAVVELSVAPGSGRAAGHRPGRQAPRTPAHSKGIGGDRIRHPDRCRDPAPTGGGRARRARHDPPAPRRAARGPHRRRTHRALRAPPTGTTACRAITAGGLLADPGRTLPPLNRTAWAPLSGGPWEAHA